MLVCSVGLSPQVVTEAVFAVARDKPTERPTELVLLTTPEGATLAKETLLDPMNGALARLAGEQDWTWLPEVSVRIVVPETEGELAGQAAISDVALGLLRELCDDAEAMVHVVLTGGRKTAAAATALAMALVARQQDRMSHVLVDERFVGNPAFFFPPQRRTMILGSDGALHDASAAEIVLLEVPFPRLRAYADTGLADFAAAIAKAQSRLDRWRLTVELDGRGILWNGQPMALPPAITAFAAWLADDLLRDAPGLPRAGVDPRGFVAAYRRIRGPDAAAKMAARLGPEVDPEWMEEKASRLNKLAAACASRPRGASLVVRVGERSRGRYCLSLDCDEIDWIGRDLAG